ncbi:MAG: DUF6498-containing protein [Candidatus Sumerlaeaceae bacterium]|nr:DUF6498-containing protein [Candidatus Sumerlaeaceae bacterium]
MDDKQGANFRFRVKVPLLRTPPDPACRDSAGGQSVAPSHPGRWRASYTALLVSNAIPLFGAAFLGWDVFTILFLFWAENVILGAFNVLRMVAASPPDNLVAQAMKLILIPFFVVHYGGFCFVHGIFVLAMFGGGLQGGDFPNPFERLVQDFFGTLAVPLIALTVSHGISFYTNYLLDGEFRRATVDKLMIQPYARIAVLHLTIILGAFLVQALGSPTYALALLVVLKTGVDFAAHRHERRKFAGAAQEPAA